MDLQRLATCTLLVLSNGCSLIVASTLDGKNGDGDADADADTDTDADCSLDSGEVFGQLSPVVINFAGGGENGPVLVQTGSDLARAGADLALIAKWNGSGGSFGYETQLFDEMWNNVTGHNRVQDVAEDPASRGGIFSSEDTVYAVFPQASTLVQVPLTFNAVAETIEEGDRVTVVTAATPVHGPTAVLANTHVFYLYSDDTPEGSDASAYAAMSPIGGAAGAPLTLNPGSGHHTNVQGAYGAAQDRVIFVYERLSAGTGDVLYGVLDTIPSVVDTAAPLSPALAQSGLPTIAASADVALVTFVTRPDASANFDLNYQVVHFSDGSLGASGVLSDVPTDAGASSVVYHPDLDEFGVAWSELGVGQNEIWAARVGTDGTPIQGATLVSDQGGDHPAVSIAPVSFGYAIVWDGGPTGLKTGWLGCVPQG